MRLLETRLPEPGEYPFRLKYVNTSQDLPYAILSHTWGDDEVLYEDVARQTGESKAGFAKVQAALRLARDDGHEHLWIDSICIDKSSSTELQEASNSMFTWYQQAAICYAYLSDVRDSHGGPVPYKEIAASRWFKRGWTLQELIAPKGVRFFDVGWTLLGDKLYLLDTLRLATRISSEVLSDTESLQSVCAAQKMSWAAGRETTRGEDRAYSLMGLFEVNMPMLYGEGPRNAFIRLQEEIMRRSDDHSLFAWCDEAAEDDELHGLLADSPDAFGSHNVDVLRQNRYVRSKEPHAMTNRGLQIKFTLLPQLEDVNMVYAASLDCHSGDPPRPVYLQLIQLDPEDNLYARVKCRNLLFEIDLTGTNASAQSIYIPQSVPKSYRQGERPEMQFFRCGPINITHFKAIPPTHAAHKRLDDHELN